MVTKVDRQKELEIYVQTLEGELEETSRGLVALTMELEQAKERLTLAASVFENSIEGIVIADAKTHILEVNKAFEKITHYKAEEVIGKTTTLLRSDWHDKAFYETMWRDIQEKGLWQGEITDRRKNGENYVQWLSICAVKDDGGHVTNYIGIFTDITIKKETERKVHQLAYYDHLTKLPNRTLFQDRLGQAIRTAKRDSKKLGVLFIDLDNFKNINDTLGHLVGDKFLIQVAERMNEAIREQDTVARIGGDEFIILLEELIGPQDASRVAKAIIGRMSEPFVIDGHEGYSVASVGISIFPDDGKDASTLVKHADTAMYTAKEQGKNDFRFFIDDMNVRTFERVRMESDLRRAMEAEEFVLHYQPRICLKTGKITGAEALIRWRHPEFGLIAPVKFIPVAEETGMIGTISDWVLSTTLRQIKSLVDQGLSPPPIAVNLSARQFKDKHFADEIITKVKQSGLSPSYVELELTESTVMSNPDAAIIALRKLKDFGIRISVDDFGTGYSSLSYLTRLPIDTVKIDQSFIHALESEKESQLIVEAIIALSHKMRLTVVAEGVEHEEEAAFLLEQSCDEIQGYYFHRPMCAEDFRTLLVSQASPD